MDGENVQMKPSERYLWVYGHVANWFTFAIKACFLLERPSWWTMLGTIFLRKCVGHVMWSKVLWNGQHFSCCHILPQWQHQNESNCKKVIFRHQTDLSVPALPHLLGDATKGVGDMDASGSMDLWAIRERSLGREASVGQMLFENELVNGIARNLPDGPRAFNMESKSVGCALYIVLCWDIFLCFSDYFMNNYEEFWARERHIDEKMSHGYDRITAAKIVDK